MGYTHYFAHPLGTKTNFTEHMPAIAEDARAILEQCLETVAGPDGVPETPPVVNDAIILFNGIEDESCETFQYPPDPEHLDFDFCKTQRCPYDAPVVAVLMAVKHHMKGQVILNTDAQPDDTQWDVPLMAEADALYHRVFPDRSYESWLTSFET